MNITQATLILQIVNALFVAGAIACVVVLFLYLKKNSR
jgi:hypothetical protein